MPQLKDIALAAGLLAALSTATPAQVPAPRQAPGSPGDTIVLEEFVTLDWIEKSEVSALREGVISKMELSVGMPIQAGNPIGYLHDQMAQLNVRKAEVAAAMKAPMQKALAQRDLAESVVALNIRLNKRVPGSVSPEEMRKAEAELKVAEGMVQEAEERTKLDQAEQALANQALTEHTIQAPFSGIVIDRLKHPGESVRANEPVVVLANLDRLKAYGYLRLDDAYRVREGMTVEFQPRLSDARGSAPLPIEQKKFLGRISFVDPTIQPVAETAVRIYAEFDNKDHQLRPGLKGVLTIYLNDGTAPAGAPAIAGPAGGNVPR